MVWPISIVNTLDRDRNKEEKVSAIQGMKEQLSFFVKSNQWFKNQAPYLPDPKWKSPYKAAEHLADYTCELLEVPDHLSNIEKAEHAAISLGHDTLWGYLLNPIAFGGIKGAGYVGNKGSAMTEARIKQLEATRKPGNVFLRS